MKRHMHREVRVMDVTNLALARGVDGMARKKSQAMLLDA